MGRDLLLFVNDESIESLQVSRSFKDQIILEGCIKFKEFLSKYETDIITPNYDGEIILSKKRGPTRTITKHEEFQNEFKECYDFLDAAIIAGRQVLWEIH